jgi:acyl carrier protein
MAEISREQGARMPDGKVTTRELVAQQLCDIIVESRPKLAGRIKPSTRLERDLGIDSLTIIETVIRIEERFAIAMPDFEKLDAGRVLCVEDLADMVMERLEVTQ